MPNLEDLPAGLATTIISPSIVTTTPAAQKNPRGVFQAGKYPMRVVVRNISPNGVGVLLKTLHTDFSKNPTGVHWKK